MKRRYSTALVVAGLALTLSGAPSWGQSLPDTGTLTTATTLRVPFDRLFRTNPDGSISPLTSVHLQNGSSSVTLNPGLSFRPGVLFMGVDIGSLMGHDLAVEQDGGTNVIKGVYP
jgi:hypothetical protein